MSALIFSLDELLLLINIKRYILFYFLFRKLQENTIVCSVNVMRVWSIDEISKLEFGVDISTIEPRTLALGSGASPSKTVSQSRDITSQQAKNICREIYLKLLKSFLKSAKCFSTCLLSPSGSDWLVTAMYFADMIWPASGCSWLLLWLPKPIPPRDNYAQPRLVSLVEFSN